MISYITIYVYLGFIWWHNTNSNSDAAPNDLFYAHPVIILHKYWWEKLTGLKMHYMFIVLFFKAYAFSQFMMRQIMIFK